MIITRDQANARSAEALRRLRSFPIDTASLEDGIAFASEMSGIAQQQAADLRETLKYLEDNGEGQSDYAIDLRRLMPLMDEKLCQMAAIDIT
jgi:hypothetical protein